MSHTLLWQRIVLAWVCAGHLLLGALALASGQRAIRIGSRLYGARFDPTAQFEYALRPLGAFMIALGALQAAAIRRPGQHRRVIDATLFVLTLRLLQRIAFARTICMEFGTPPVQHWRNTLFFGAHVPLLLWVRRAGANDPAE